jgi:hypothetical protein
MASVIVDSGVSFNHRAGSPSEALSLLRAKEQVQAALAASAKRLQLEAEARKAAGEVAVAPAVVIGLVTGQGMRDQGIPLPRWLWSADLGRPLLGRRGWRGSPPLHQGRLW